MYPPTNTATIEQLIKKFKSQNNIAEYSKLYSYFHAYGRGVGSVPSDT